MPTICCVPDCKGNYPSGPRVSCFAFPKDEYLCQKWLQAIKRKSFTPSKFSKVCELHFKPHDVERETSCYDEKNGRFLTAPLMYPRLRKGAVPSIIPGRPDHVSSNGLIPMEEVKIEAIDIDECCLDVKQEDSRDSDEEFNSKGVANFEDESIIIKDEIDPLCLETEITEQMLREFKEDCCYKSIGELCRICANYSDEGISLQDELLPGESSCTVIKFMERVFSVKIQHSPRYPNTLCKSCLKKLRVFGDLKEIFEKSQNLFEKLLILNLPDTEKADKRLLSSSSNDENEEPEVSCKDKEVEETLCNSDEDETSVKEVGDYRCKNCNKIYNGENALKQHAKFCKDYFSFKCDHCIQTFKSKKKKYAHMRYHHQKRKYICDICGQVFPSTGTVWYHKNRVHVKKPYPCKICGRIFNMKNSYTKHLNTHNKHVAKVICQICGKGFHYESGLFYHMRVHNNIRNYKCAYCQRRFLTMSSLKRHTRVHTGERPYHCIFCAKSFSSLTEVKTHERRHTGYKPFKCVYCKTGYISLYNMRLHMSTHRGNYPCDICGKGFLDTVVLNLHMKFKHNKTYKLRKEGD